MGCQGTHLGRRVVEAGERGGKQCHEYPANGCHHGGEGNELHRIFLGLFYFPCTQILADDDAYGGAKREGGDGEQLPNGLANLVGCHGGQTAGGVALRHEGHAQRPEGFVKQQGQTLQGE